MLGDACERTGMSSDTEDKELAFTPAYQLAKFIKSKQLSPVELMEVTLRRINQIDPVLNAFLTVDEEGAMSAAHRAEEALSDGASIGLLHGLPVSIKDLVKTKGMQTTMGSLVYQNLIPDSDSALVARLRAAGAIIIGKTNTSEFGLALSTENKLRDDCRNPWDTSRTAGGSSGGAAASIAAGLTQ